jgi:DNA-binding transcriptional ArsR family regulator
MQKESCKEVFAKDRLQSNLGGMSEQDVPQPGPSHPSFDPERDVVLDARTIKGLAHPLRVQLLGLLREFGPSTATELGRRMGQSSGVTSYHLRQLAEFGFVEEDEGRGTGRERWWRSRHRGTYFDPFVADETTRAAGEESLRAVARANAERLMRFVDGMSTYVDEMGPGWEHGSTLSDSLLWLTAEESTQLGHDLDALVARYVRAPEASKEGRTRVVVQYQVLPQPPEATTGSGDE